jgi:hypothetical protein
MIPDFILKALAQDAPAPIQRPDPVGFTSATPSNISILPETGTLADKIKTGDIHLSDIPDFISYFIQIGIMIAGIVAFLMILVGGYQYIIGGVYSEQREKGKQTLIYAVSGFILAMLAYAIVTLVQLFATSI